MTKNYEEMNVRQLRGVAKGLPGNSKAVAAGKAALIQFLKDYDLSRELPEQVAETQQAVDDVLGQVEDGLEVADRAWRNVCDALKTPAGWLTILFVVVAATFRLAVYIGELSVLAYKGWAVAVPATIQLGRDVRQDPAMLVRPLLGWAWERFEVNAPFKLG